LDFVSVRQFEHGAVNRHWSSASMLAARGEFFSVTFLTLGDAFAGRSVLGSAVAHSRRLVFARAGAEGTAARPTARAEITSTSTSLAP